MANHKSAKKRARQNVQRAERNRGGRSKLKTAVRAFREAVTQTPAASEEALNVAARAMRKAATKGFINKKTASRRVSRMVKAFNRASAAPAS